MKTVKIIIAVLVLLLGAFLVFKAWQLSSPTSGSPTASEQPAIAEFFDLALPAEIEEYRIRNADALSRFQERLNAQFDTYRENIPAFVEDSTDYGSKIKIICKSSDDFVKKLRKKDKEAIQVETYMVNKFHHHFFTPEELRIAFKDIVDQFTEDIMASRKLLYAKLKQKWEKKEFSSAPFPTDEILLQSDEQLRHIMNTQGFEFGAMSTGAVIGSELLASAANFLVRKLYVVIVSTTLTFSATTATTTAGTTAVSSTGGAAAGSPGGPAVALIGFGAGLAVGVIVDWYMTDRMQEKLTGTLEDYFDEISKIIVLGTEKEVGVIRGYELVIDKMPEKETELITKKLEELN